MSTPAPGRLVLACGAGALFFLSFLMSGSSNALPQVFLQAHAPQDKARLLALTLLLATLAATLGVVVSRRCRLGATGVLAGGLAIALALQALLAASSVPAFIALLVVLEFAVNLQLDQVDRGSVARAGPLLAFNDTAGVTARLAGMLAAPAFFTLAAQSPGFERAVLGVLGVASAIGAWHVLRLPEVARPPADPAAATHAPLPRDRLLFGYAVGVYAGMYLFAANAIFLLQDVLRIEGAQAKGGALVVTVFAAAIVANGAGGWLARGRAARAAPRIAVLAAPAVALALAAAVPLAGWRPAYAGCLLACAAIGLGYGFFLRELRRHASRAAVEGRAAVLGWFNNLGNASALLAFALMLAISRAVPAESYYAGLLGTVLALQCGGAVLLTVLRTAGMRPAMAS